MGAAALAFFPCQLRRGIDIVLDSVGLDAALEGADLVITGEGRLDGQTVFGKTPIGVARRAKQHGLPVIAIGGSLGDGVEAVHQHCIDAVFACVQQITTLDDALENAARATSAHYWHSAAGLETHSPQVRPQPDDRINLTVKNISYKNCFVLPLQDSPGAAE
ncbi:Glycerate kinase [compost metagenome]